MVDGLDTFGFQSSKCSRLLPDGVEMCKECWDSRNRFYRRMDAAVELRDADTTLKTKRSVTDLSPGLSTNILNLVMKDRRSEQYQRNQAKRKLKRLSTGNCGDVLSLDSDKFKSDLIFDDELAELGKNTSVIHKTLTKTKVLPILLSKVIFLRNV